MSELPKSWCETPIESITLPVDKIGNAQPFDKKIRYIDISSIDNVRNVVTEAKELNLSDAPSRARQIVKAGDVLFATVRPYLRNIAAVPDIYDGEVASTGFSVLRPVEGMHPKYLFHFCTSTAFVNELSGIQYGVSYPAVKDEQVRAQLIPLPPANEQKRIVAKIEELFSELDSGIESLKTAREQLKVYRQAVLKHAFEGKLTAPWREKNKVSSDWKPIRLGEIIKVSSGKNLTAKQMRVGSYPVYGGNGINGYHDEFNISEKKLIIGRVGVKCGVTHITEEKCWVTDNALIVDFLVNNIDMNFFEKRLGYENLNKLSASTAQPVISGSKIYAVEMLLPSLEEQRHIAAAVDHFISVAEKLENTIDTELQKSEALRQSILKKAFSGQLVAQNPADEPASLLLERIRNEKEKGKGKQPSKPKKRAA